MSNDIDVAVIGAGVAGLAAGRHLAKKGARFVVLEAMDRIGGRGLTDTARFANPVDLGATWLHSNNKNPFGAKLAKQGLERVRDPSRQMVAIAGVLQDRNTVGMFDNYQKVIEKTISATVRARGDVAVSDVLQPITPLERLAVALNGPIEYGAEIDQLSTYDVDEQEATGVEDLVPTGLGAAIAAYGAKVPVRLNAAVRRIRWDGEGVELSGDGFDLRASACIVTVSTGVLNAGLITFVPELPERHRRAIANLPMGLLNKVHLAFKSDPFGDAVPATTSLTALTKDGRVLDSLLKPFGRLRAEIFLGGNLAHEFARQPDAAAVAFARDGLAEIFGAGVQLAFDQGFVTRWQDEPWIRGAYSYALPGQARARRVLARPVGGRLFFAGEALDMGWATQVAAAYLTGKAQAKAALTAIAL